MVLLVRAFGGANAVHILLVPLCICNFICGRYLTAAKTIDLSPEQLLQFCDLFSARFDEISEPKDLVNVLAATPQYEVVHKRFVKPLFTAINRKGWELDWRQLLSCVWAIHTMEYSKPKFRKKIGSMLKIQVKERNVPFPELIPMLPMLDDLGMWLRIDPKTQNKLWEKLDKDTRALLRKCCFQTFKLAILK